MRLQCLQVCEQPQGHRHGDSWTEAHHTAKDAPPERRRGPAHAGERHATRADAAEAHPRARAPPPERKTSRRWGKYNSQKSAKLHLSPQDFEAWKAERGAPAGAETEPSFGLMPTCPAAIVNDGMRAFLAPDRSGEVSPAASAESWSVGLPQTALSPAPLDEIFPTVCLTSRGA